MAARPLLFLAVVMGALAQPNDPLFALDAAAGNDAVPSPTSFPFALPRTVAINECTLTSDRWVAREVRSYAADASVTLDHALTFDESGVMWLSTTATSQPEKLCPSNTARWEGHFTDAGGIAHYDLRTCTLNKAGCLNCFQGSGSANYSFADECWALTVTGLLPTTLTLEKHQLLSPALVAACVGGTLLLAIFGTYCASSKLRARIRTDADRSDSSLELI